MAGPTQLHVADLSPQALTQVREVEKSLGGTVVVAYEPPVTPATLTPEQVHLLQDAERELGVCLVAYRRNA